MRRWYFRHASTVILAATLPLKLLAQPAPANPPVPVPAIPPANVPANPAAAGVPVVPANPVAPGNPVAPALPPGNGLPPGPGVVGGLPALPPGVFVGSDAYRAATPYNATVVGRAAPNPAYNRCNMTLPCVNPNQNFAPLELIPPDCFGKLFGIFAHFTRYSGANGGCCGGLVGGCDGFLPSGNCGAGVVGVPVAAKSTEGVEVAQVGFFHFIRGKKDGYDNGPTVVGVGSCATCGNTANFVFGSSRSFFGESSREFFERPPSVDGVRFKVNPPPVIYRQHPYYAPAAPQAVPANLASLQPQ